MTDVGDRLKGLREWRHMTKADLARKSGVSAPYIHQIEEGVRSKPSDTVLRALAGALGVRNYELLEPAGYRFEGEGYFDNYDRAIAELRDHLGDSDYGIYFNDIIEEMPNLARWTASGPTLPSGPKGWDELSDDDQRLAQKLIDRLRGESDETPADE